MEGEVLDHVDRYLQVEEILGLDITEQDGPDVAPYRITAVEDVERAATSVRTAWNLGGGPIPDMTELLEERGIKVFKFSLPGSVDGLSSRIRRVRGGADVPVVVCSIGQVSRTSTVHHCPRIGALGPEISHLTVPEEKSLPIALPVPSLHPRNELVSVKWDGDA